MIAPPSTLLLRRLTLPKFLYRSAKDAVSRPQPPHSWGLATSLLQDSAEVILRLIAEHHQIRVTTSASFGALLQEVEQRFPILGGHRASLTALNTARVAFKHRGHEVAEKDAQVFVWNVELFLTSAYKEAFAIDFASLSLADSIGHIRTQNWLKRAESAYVAERYGEAVAHAAKAMTIYMAHITGNDPAIELRSVVQYRRREVNDFESWVDAILPLLQARFDLFTRGVDVAAFDRFMMLTPHTTLSRYGSIEQHPRSNNPQPSQGDARFCIDFAVDSALALRDRSVLVTTGAMKQLERVRLKSRCEVFANWKTTADRGIPFAKNKEREVIRVAQAGEILTIASVWRGVMHRDYIPVLQDGDPAYVSRECVDENPQPGQPVKQPPTRSRPIGGTPSTEQTTSHEPQ